MDAFPLQNPDASAVEVADLLQKQLDILQTLLVDPDPHVRIAAIVGVCRILTVYWEAVPLGVIKAYITRYVCMHICMYVCMVSRSRFLCIALYVHIMTLTQTRGQPRV